MIEIEFDDLFIDVSGDIVYKVLDTFRVVEGDISEDDIELVKKEGTWRLRILLK